MDERQQLEAAVARVRRRARIACGARVLSAAAFAAALGFALAGPTGLAAGLLGLVLLRGPGLSLLVRRLDAALGAAGAFECAWDHRDGESPMLVAQRRRALALIKAEAARVAAPSPHFAWLLPPLLWVWPALTPRAEPPPTPTPPPGAAAAQPKGEGATTDPEPGAEPRKAGAAAKAHEDSPDAGAAAEAGAAGGGAAGAKAKVGGVGTTAGARSGGGAGAHKVVVGGGAGSVVVPRARPTALPVTKPEATLDPSDPARPYPRRYRALIHDWFGRAGD